MATANSIVRRPKKVTPPPTERESTLLAQQLNALLNIDGHLHNVITNDVEMGLVDNPFIHPLYQLRTRLDAYRGKKAKRLASYARSLRQNSKAKKD